MNLKISTIFFVLEKVQQPVLSIYPTENTGSVPRHRLFPQPLDFVVEESTVPTRITPEFLFG